MSRDRGVDETLAELKRMALERPIHPLPDLMTTRGDRHFLTLKHGTLEQLAESVRKIGNADGMVTIIVAKSRFPKD